MLNRGFMIQLRTSASFIVGKPAPIEGAVIGMEGEVPTRSPTVSFKPILSVESVACRLRKMKPTLALVRYTSDKKRDVVKIGDISNFSPKSVNDFDPDKIYEVQCSVVRRSDSDLHDEHSKKGYSAKIRLLAASDLSMISHAKSKKEALPPGYADRIRKGMKEQKKEKDQQRQSLKRDKRSLRQSKQENLMEIIKVNLEANSKNTDINISTHIGSESSNETNASDGKTSSIEAGKETDKIELEEVNESIIEAEKKNTSTEIEEKNETIEANKKNRSTEIEEKTETIEWEEKNKTPDIQTDKENESSETKEKDAPATTTDRVAPHLDLPTKRDLFGAGKKGTRSEPEDDSESSDDSGSYQSSEGKIIDLESQICTLQLENQSLKKRVIYLSKHLQYHLDVLNEQADTLENILKLHGETSNIAVTTNTNNWIVVPSPMKSQAIRRGPAQDLEAHTPPKKRACDISSLDLHESKCSAKKSSVTPSKSPKTKNMSKKKTNNSLQPGEVKAEVLANDLLKVLKKEREIQMNEDRTRVCIGNNTWVKRGVWKEKFSKSNGNMKKLVNELAEEVWGLEKCATFSLTGGKSPKNPSATPKQPAPAGKVEAIFGLCRAHLMWQGMVNSDHLDHGVHQCRDWLRSKFNEAARKIKRSDKKKRDEDD
ncbi:BEN domain-containing protein 5 [Frankliniella fusca]|uniref:BEN domain-containing protein 5 n=1 Tax=Frankliniella fusca TaxID=407009 RepID=A0AAE1LHH5_9NEOP|nr:BEN domain-containing protein 5 [Frankliniella fusca]